MSTRRDLVVIERGERNFSAYVPDLPGCIATGATRDETVERMREAIALHIEGPAGRRGARPRARHERGARRRLSSATERRPPSATSRGAMG